MKKDLPEKQDDETPESLSNWSNIDATSIYRAGNESKNPADQPQLNQIVKETNSFLKIGLVMLIIAFIIIFVSSYY